MFQVVKNVERDKVSFSNRFRKFLLEDKLIILKNGLNDEKIF